jgi:hypothetical protein
MLLPPFTASSRPTSCRSMRQAAGRVPVLAGAAEEVEDILAAR